MEGLFVAKAWPKQNGNIWAKHSIKPGWEIDTDGATGEGGQLLCFGQESGGGGKMMERVAADFYSSWPQMTISLNPKIGKGIGGLELNVNFKKNKTAAKFCLIA